jgi:uncharacterized membrane protein (UPF0127 family)
MNGFIRIAWTAITVLAAVGGSLPAAAAEFPRVELHWGMHRIEAEVAHRPAQLAQGLMHRREMAMHRGMLFVFEGEARHCMWMRNTLIPLSVAFLDGEGRVINIADMAPQDETAHCAARPARYALEMNRGWFAARGVREGAAIGGLGRAPAFRRE